MANVLLLLSDEHNPRYAAPYGHPMVRTPNMDRLARAGTLYERAYCASPLCLPSRSAFMAGRYVHELQTYSNCNLGLGFDYPTYGAVLAEQGVQAVHIGKTHAYNCAGALGFSEMILPLDVEPPGDTNHRRRPLAIRPDALERAGGYGPHPRPFGPDPGVVDAAVAWIEERGARLGRPWVLSVNINAPHFPHYTTQELWDLYPEAGDVPEHGLDCASAQHPYARDLRRHFQTEAFGEADVRGLRRGYLGCITYVDGELGRLLDALERAGLAETTNVIYGADHGEMLGKFGMWWKCSLYEDSVRVPLIAAGPDFTAGARVATPVSLLDAQAAIMRAVGAERPAHWRGAPLQDIAPQDPQRVVFAEYHGHGTRSGAYMIRRGDWKLIYVMEGPHQLFNLAHDPEELENLVDRRPEVLSALEAELRAICDPEEENRRAHAFQDRQLARLRGEPDIDMRLTDRDHEEGR